MPPPLALSNGTAYHDAPQFLTAAVLEPKHVSISISGLFAIHDQLLQKEVLEKQNAVLRQKLAIASTSTTLIFDVPSVNRSGQQLVVQAAAGADFPTVPETMADLPLLDVSSATFNGTEVTIDLPVNPLATSLPPSGGKLPIATTGLAAALSSEPP